MQAGLVADPSYRAIVADRATVSVQLLQADASLIEAKRDALSLGDAGVAYRRYSYRNEDGTEVWYGTLGRSFAGLDGFLAKTGEIADDPNNSCLLYTSRCV